MAAILATTSRMARELCVSSVYEFFGHTPEFLVRILVGHIVVVVARETQGRLFVNQAKHNKLPQLHSIDTNTNTTGITIVTIIE